MKKILALILVLSLTLSMGIAFADEADDYYLEIKFSNVFQPTEWNYKASQKLAGKAFNQSCSDNKAS